MHALLANDLVDAMSIFTVPVVLGGGKKLFADGSAPHSFKLTGSRVSSKLTGSRVSSKLTDSRVSSSGTLIGHYERGRKIKIDDTAPDSPSDREISRRKRMKREG